MMKGFEWAAAHPVEAADILVAGAKETGFDLDAEMVRVSKSKLFNDIQVLLMEVS